MPPACFCCYRAVLIKVVTGVAVVWGSGSAEVAAEMTQVTMRTLFPQEVADYVAGGEPMDKAGAYAIQSYAGRWIPRLHGCYFNVVGLPLALVTSLLEGAELRMANQIEPAKRSNAPLIDTYGSVQVTENL